jgi:hypothetical protein
VQEVQARGVQQSVALMARMRYQQAGERQCTVVENLTCGVFSPVRHTKVYTSPCIGVHCTFPRKKWLMHAPLTISCVVIMDVPQDFWGNVAYISTSILCSTGSCRLLCNIPSWGCLHDSCIIPCKLACRLVERHSQVYMAMLLLFHRHEYCMQPAQESVCEALWEPQEGTHFSDGILAAQPARDVPWRSAANF